MIAWTTIYRAHWDFLTDDKVKAIDEFVTAEIPDLRDGEMAATVRALTETWGDDQRRQPPLASDIVKAIRSRRARAGNAPGHLTALRRTLADATPERRWEIMCELPHRDYIALTNYVASLPGGECPPDGHREWFQQLGKDLVGAIRSTPPVVPEPKAVRS
jgi:hypothetical protein